MNYDITGGDRGDGFDAVYDGSDDDDDDDDDGHSHVYHGYDDDCGD